MGLNIFFILPLVLTDNGVIKTKKSKKNYKGKNSIGIN